MTLPSRLLTLSLLLAPLTVGAQYRPPPMTPAERTAASGDELRLQASQALSKGDKKRALDLHHRAMELYVQALKQDPESASAAAGLGASGMAVGEYAPIVDNAAKAASAHPDQLDVIFPVGVAYFKLKRYGEALPLLERVSQANQPEQFIVHYYLGAFLLQQKAADRAATELRTYLSQRPESLAGNDFQIYEYLGAAYLQLHDPSSARAAYQRAQVGRQESVSVQLGLVAVLEMEGKVAEARTMLEGLSQRFPKVPEPLERLGRLWLAAGDVPRADAAASKLLGVDASARGPLLMGDVRLAQGRWTDAEQQLRRALSLSPGWFPAQVSLARALQAQGRRAEAIALIEKLTTGTASSNVEAWAALGSVLRRAGRYQQAVEAHERVVKLAPSSALGHVLLGADYFATGEWDRTIDSYEAALKADPRHPAARHWLARALSQRARQRVENNHVMDGARDLGRAFDLERTPELGRSLGAALLAGHADSEARTALTATTSLKDAGWQEFLLLGYAELGSGGSAVRAGTAFEEAAKHTNDPEAQRQVYIGWSLAKLEQGQFDLAVQKLSENAQGLKGTGLAQANLGLALLRRAMSRLESGDTAGAQKDWEAEEKLGLNDRPELTRMAGVVRALLDAEQNRPDRARAALARALTPQPTWASANALPLLEAYLAYRQGDMGNARKALGRAARKKTTPEATDFLGRLTRAVDRREGELRYVRGDFAPAERALMQAKAADPLNPYVLHNLACVATRRPKARLASSLSVWEGLSATLPEASLNLGIDAQERQRDFSKAFTFYDKYLSAGGTRSVVRQWRDRLGALYGFQSANSDSAAGSTEAGGAP